MSVCRIINSITQLIYILILLFLTCLVCLRRDGMGLKFLLWLQYRLGCSRKVLKGEATTNWVQAIFGGMRRCRCKRRSSKIHPQTSGSLRKGWGLCSHWYGRAAHAASQAKDSETDIDICTKCSSFINFQHSKRYIILAKCFLILYLGFFFLLNFVSLHIVRIFFLRSYSE
ncbi:uncharacterized protein LOC123217673 [Mangifera indica]|uniref:uncharacterized protein LOC123217673 n=1 Tax=Mangifera indica TaxID=29780 RepID=UPI001CFB501C|nr:uncharacterized protein LOC123217673 [Mangifera indica]